MVRLLVSCRDFSQILAMKIDLICRYICYYFLRFYLSSMFTYKEQAIFVDISDKNLV